MTKIYTVTDFTVPFGVVSINYAIENLVNYIPNCTVKTYNLREEFIPHKIDIDVDNDVIFLCEVGYCIDAGLTTSDIFKYYPNGKIVILGCDTQYFMFQEKHFQWHNPHEVDLTLDLMPQCVDVFKEHNITADLWMWTVSDSLLQLLKLNYGNIVDYDRKKYNFIGVYGPWTISNKDCYRHHMVNYITDNGLTFTRGNGNGFNDKDLGNLYCQYLNSWLTLGTTSHNNPFLTRMGGMKGFRDWIGPLLHCPVIYDSHENIQKLFCPNNKIPLYNYDKFDEIVKLGRYYSDINNRKEYEELIAIQTRWSFNNTIDKQLYRLLTQYNII